MKSFVRGESRDFGKFLQNKRIEVGLSQGDVGRELKFGSKAQAVSNWERGDALPPKGKLRAIAHLYKMTYDELVEEYVIYRLIQTQEKLFADFYPQQTNAIKSA